MRKLTTNEFIKRACNVHGDKYDYSLVNYVNSKINVNIICPEHGIFEQLPLNHINLNQGCPICVGRGKGSTERFIKDAKKVHGNKYDYSLTIFINSKIKIEIICPEHGIFKQFSNNHLSGRGCPKCNGGVRNSQENFISKSNKTHEYKYDYSLINYINNYTNVEIICPEHGIFKQKPNHHISGHGCPECNNKSKGEKIINNLLNKYSIKFETQKSFSDCKNKLPLSFDFYLPNENMLIEYDGKQHYSPIEYFGGEDTLKYIQSNDKIKTEYALTNNIKLLRIPYTERKKLSSILKNNITT